MELLPLAVEGGRNCLVVTDKPCMHLFVDAMGNYGLNSTKKSIVVAQCQDVIIKGTTAKLQVSITATKDASRMLDDITAKAAPIANGVYVAMLPGTDKKKILHIRVNFTQIANTNPANKQVINLNQKKLGAHSGLMLNATVTSSDGFSVDDMEESFMGPPPTFDAAVVAAATQSPAAKVPPPAAPLAEPPAIPSPVLDSPVSDRSPKLVEPTVTARHPSTDSGRLTRAQSMRMEALDENFTIDNTDKRHVRVIVTFDRNAVSGDRLALSKGLGGIGYTIVVVRTDRAMGNAGSFQPAPKSLNLEFTEDATRRQLVMRFDRTKDVTAQTKSATNTKSRVCSTTEGTVSMGCADVKFVAMYVMDDVKDDAYSDAVYALLYPRPQHGLTNLNMNEVMEEVLLKLCVRQPTSKNYANVRDAVRSYLSKLNLRRSNTMKWRSHDF